MWRHQCDKTKPTKRYNEIWWHEDKRERPPFSPHQPTRQIGDSSQPRFVIRAELPFLQQLTAAKVVDPKRDPLGKLFGLWSKQHTVMVVMLHICHKFVDSGKMLIFNLLVSCRQNTAWGERLPTHCSDVVCVASKAPPTYKTGQNFLLQSGVCCAEREQVPTPGLILNWGRTQPADSDTTQQWQGYLLVFSPAPRKHSGCHSIAPGLSRARSSFSCHPRQGKQPLVMQDARDGGSDTGFPGDYTDKLSVDCKHCEKDRHFFGFWSVNHHDTCQELK